MMASYVGSIPFCEICGYDIAEAIEGHHVIPQEYKAPITEKIFLCANCHKLLHYPFNGGETHYLSYILNNTIKKEERNELIAKHKLSEEEIKEDIELTGRSEGYDPYKVDREAINNNKDAIRAFIKNNRKEILSKIKEYIQKTYRHEGKKHGSTSAE